VANAGFGAPSSSATHIHAIRARLALAVWLGRSYDGSGNAPERERGDVAPGVHTRYHHPNGYLRVREDAPPHHLYVLVVPAPHNTLRIIGYAPERDVMRDGYWRASWQHPCWAVRYDDPTIRRAATFQHHWLDGDGFGWLHT
jgi:hypothetical protein